MGRDLVEKIAELGVVPNFNESLLLLKLLCRAGLLDPIRGRKSKSSSSSSSSSSSQTPSSKSPQPQSGTKDAKSELYTFRRDASSKTSWCVHA